MTGRKKIWIIAAAVLVFVALAFGAIVLQNTLLEGSNNSSDRFSSFENSSSFLLSSNKISEESNSTSFESSSQNSSLSSKNSVSSPSGGGNSVSDRSSVSSSSASAVSKPEAKKTVDIAFYDNVNKQAIFAGSTVWSSESTVGDYTKAILDQNSVNGKKKYYSYSGTGATIYFQMIAGLRERGAGPNSGWLFYVKKAGEENYTRSSIGAGNVRLEPGDSVRWEYVKTY